MCLGSRRPFCKVPPERGCRGVEFPNHKRISKQFTPDCHRIYRVQSFKRMKHSKLDLPRMFNPWLPASNLETFFEMESFSVLVGSELGFAACKQSTGSPVVGKLRVSIYNPYFHSYRYECIYYIKSDNGE